jgi:hypothetical protein
VKVICGISPEIEMDVVCVQTWTFEELDLARQLTIKQPA